MGHIYLLRYLYAKIHRHGDHFSVKGAGTTAGHAITGTKGGNPFAHVHHFPRAAIAQGRGKVQFIHHLFIGGFQPFGFYRLHNLFYLIRLFFSFLQQRGAGRFNLAAFRSGADQRKMISYQNITFMKRGQRHFQQFHFTGF